MARSASLRGLVDDFVGRAPVVDRLERDLAGGRGSFVTGPPGIGVTACLRALTERLRARGKPVAFTVARFDAGGAPTGGVTVVDDADRLPDAQAAALRDAVVNESARVVVGTTHAGACAPAFSWLWSSGTLARADLAPLDADDVAALVERAAHAPPDGATLRSFLADSAGVPAFLVPTLAGAPTNICSSRGTRPTVAAGPRSGADVGRG